MNTDELSKRIIADADKRLRFEINEISQKLHDLLCDGSQHCITVVVSKEQTVSVTWYTLLEALKHRAFEIHCESCREHAIAEFIDRANQLATAKTKKPNERTD